MRTTSFAVLSLSLLVADLGCHAFNAQRARGDRADDTKHAPAEVFAKLRKNRPFCGEKSFEFSETGSLENNVHAVSCSRGRISETSQLNFLRRFTETEASPLEAAVAVVSCLSSKRCSKQGTSTTLLKLAQAAEVADVEAALGGLELDREAGETFVRLFAASKRLFVDALAAIPESHKRVFLYPVKKAEERWKREQAALASFDDQLKAWNADLDQALVNDKVPRSLIARAEKLRRDYLRACTELDRDVAHCLGRPVARNITERLVHVQAARKDQLGELAERILVDNIVSRAELDFELHLVAKEEASKEARRYEEYQKAKAQGVSEAALAKRFDPRPLHPRELKIHGIGRVPPRGRHDGFSYKIKSGSFLLRKEAVVERVKRGRELSTIHFVRKSWIDDVGIGCRETKQVDYINRDTGEVVYRQKCKRWVKKKVFEKKPPIRVPAIEANKLRAGDIVVLHHNKAGEGRIVSVYDQGPDNKRSTRKQIGAFRLVQ